MKQAKTENSTCQGPRELWNELELLLLYQALRSSIDESLCSEYATALEVTDGL